jgi:hypothetical protein
MSYMNEREFQIPITLPADPDFQAKIEQLFLYVSTDQGKTWHQEAVATPRDKYFSYFAPRDGHYWFNVSITDKQKQSYPPDISSVPPALKVIVDTRKPVLKLSGVERHGDQVTVSWDVRDDNLDLNALRLEYNSSDSATWYQVPVTPPAARGQKSWTVHASGKVLVRLQAQDLAGNADLVQAEASVESPSGLNLTSSTAMPPGPALARPPAAPVDSPFPNQNWQRTPLEMPPPPPVPPVEVEASRPPEPMSKPASLHTPGDRPAPVEDLNAPRVIARATPPPPPSWTAAASTPPPWPSDPTPTTRTKPPGPMLQYTNQLAVDLNYEVSKVGPSGIGEVQLWVTQDDGRTWRHLEDDPDLEPPFSLELPGEGTYGFWLVIRSKGGLYRNGRQAPQPGDIPELRLEVDTTPPEAALYTVEADPRKKDVLYLLWSAADRNLSPRPITFKWSEKAGGPWQEIAVDLPNTGRHEWQMPTDLPYRVFIRMEIRDLAGNVSVAETPEPVLVDLTEPEGGITGLVPSAKK